MRIIDWSSDVCSSDLITDAAKKMTDKSTETYGICLRDIPAGQELFYDYGLIMDGRITKTLRRDYLCLCGTERCRGTMLALPKKKADSKKKKAEEKPKDKQKSAKKRKAKKHA